MYYICVLRLDVVGVDPGEALEAPAPEGLGLLILDPVVGPHLPPGAVGRLHRRLVGGRQAGAGVPAPLHHMVGDGVQLRGDRDAGGLMGHLEDHLEVGQDVLEVVGEGDAEDLVLHLLEGLEQGHGVEALLPLQEGLQHPQVVEDARALGALERTFSALVGVGNHVEAPPEHGHQVLLAVEEPDAARPDEGVGAQQEVDAGRARLLQHRRLKSGALAAHQDQADAGVVDLGVLGAQDGAVVQPGGRMEVWAR